MPAMLLQTMRSRWFTIAVHVGLWLLLYLAVTNLGGKTPDYHASSSYSPAPQSPAPVNKLVNLFSPAQWPKTLVQTNQLSPFTTTYFVPAPAPAPPAPTTRKIEITYQGYYQAGDSPLHAVVKVADAFVDVAVGAQVATNNFVAMVTIESMTLTNLAAQTNLLHLNVKQEIEVPIK
jgi:hypothetical protein